MENYQIIIFFIIFFLIGMYFILSFLKKIKKDIEEKMEKDRQERINEKNSDQSFLMLQNQLNKIIEANQKIIDSSYKLNISNERLKSDLTEKINKKLDISQKEMNDSVKIQFQESQKLIKHITEELGEVKKTSGQVVSFTEQLKNIQDILQNSKQRGILGEYFLETTIKNILPPESYEFQYSFKDGLIVDAVIKLPDGIIPIDSKFSLENYNKIISENDPEKKKIFKKKFREDLKKRIVETSKYIKPKDGTMDFAFMFIPSEGIYYDLLISKVGVIDSKNFLEYAFRDKKVIIVSPTTLHAYLQTVMQGLKNLKIEKHASKIAKKVEDLQKHMNNYVIYHEKLGNVLATTINHYNKTSKLLNQISNDTNKITGDGEIFSYEFLEGPTNNIK